MSTAIVQRRCKSTTSIGVEEVIVDLVEGACDVGMDEIEGGVNALCWAEENGEEGRGGG